MSNWDIRAVFSRAGRKMRDRSSMGAMRRTAGRASSRADGQWMEQLEQRVLLAGDHPSLSDFPNATEVIFDINGRGFQTGVIETAGSNDLFRFTAPSTDFVRILADTRNVSPVSPLNSRVRLYDSNGVFLRSSSGNSVLTGGTPTDAWLGFVATQGETYYVEVLSDAATGASATGSYILRVNASSLDLDVGDDGRAKPVSTPTATPIFGVLGGNDIANPGNQFSQDDIVYRITLPTDEVFTGLGVATLFALNGTADLDPRLDVYDSQGQLIAFDSQRAFQTDAFAYFSIQAGDTYYVRVRSDEFGSPLTRPSAGDYVLRLQVVSQEVPIDQVRRRGAASNPDGGAAGALADANDFAIFRFKAEGADLGFIEAAPTIANTPPAFEPPPHDLSLWLLGEQGNLLNFSDDVQLTRRPQILQPLTAGASYFVIVTGFDDVPSGPFQVWFEVSHTFNAGLRGGVNDDHPDTPADDLPALERARLFSYATVLRWSNPQVFGFDYDGNPILDHAPITIARGEGRIHGPADTDLFQFVLPMDMLGQYNGQSDSAGSALWVGGNFSGANQSQQYYPVDSRHLAIWDMANWWFAGNQGNPADGEFQLGFHDNPFTTDSDTAAIYAMEVVEVDLGFGPQPALIVAGDFELRIPGSQRPVNRVFNIAMRFFNQSPLVRQYQWTAITPTFILDDDFQASGLHQPVYALANFTPEVYDPDGSGPLPDITQPLDGVPQLAVGGAFTGMYVAAPDPNDPDQIPTTIPMNRLARWDLETFGWNNVGGVFFTSGAVRSLAVFDPADPGPGRDAQPGPPPLGEVADPFDPPSTLFIGGDFAFDGPARATQGGGTANFTASNFVAFLGDTFHPGAFGVNAPLPSINGPVYSMVVYDQKDTDDAEVPPRLIIAGNFSNAYGLQVNNLIALGDIDETQDPEAPVYEPQLLAINLGSSAQDPIYAMDVWTPPDVTGQGEPFDGETPILVVGGGNTFFGFINMFFGGWANSVGEFDAPVRAIEVMLEVNDPAVINRPDVQGARSVVYVGGEFTRIEDFVPIHAGGLAYFDVSGWSGTDEGVNGHVFSLANFDDQDPTIDDTAAQWNRGQRPSTSLEIILRQAEYAYGGAFQVRIFDSNLQLVYTNSNRPDDNDGDDYTVIAGARDRATQPGIAQNLIVPGLWAGEVYYLEIASVGGNGSGRYQFELRADAADPVDPDGDGIFPFGNSWYQDVPDADKIGFPFNQIVSLVLNTAGDRSNFIGVADSGSRGTNLRLYNGVRFGVPATGINSQGFYRGIDSDGMVVWSSTGLGRIIHINDSDVYSFTAPLTGTVEVTLQTLGITNQYLEWHDRYTPWDMTDPYFDNDADDSIAAELTRTYNSPLDGLIRVFDNDLEQIGYNEGGFWINGDRQNQTVGTLGSAPYGKRDPRVVVQVEAGTTYYIVVESAQKYALGSPAEIEDRVTRSEQEIDWRFATGSYQLFINAPSSSATPNGLNVMDDHHDSSRAEATVIPIAQNGTGRVDLFINDRGTPLEPDDDYAYSGTISRADDIDLFKFVAINSGTATLTITRGPGTPSLIPTVQVVALDNSVIAQGAATSSGVLTINFPVNHGEEILLRVGSGGGTLGEYIINLQTPAFVDDFANAGQYHLAHEIEFIDFLGQGRVNGAIETFGDTDLFKFRALDYQAMTISLVPSGAFRGQFVIWEQTEDPLGFAIMRRLAAADGELVPTTTGVTVNLNAERFSSLTGKEYPYYFIEVSGVDPAVDRGSYLLRIDFDPTDDHADVADFADPFLRSLATQIVLDSITGEGLSSGIIEVESDTDMFFFTAAAGGPSAFRVDAVAGSLLQGTVTLADIDGVPIVSGQIGEEIEFTAVRNARYYLFVEPDLNAAESSRVGGYEIFVEAPPIDDHPNVGEFSIATIVTLSSLDGNAQVGTGDPNGQNPTLFPRRDSDLFRFTTIAPGQTLITVTPVGDDSTLLPRITIFDSTFAQIADISAEASEPLTLDLGVTPGQTLYYVLVRSATGFAPDPAPYMMFIDSEDGSSDPSPDPGVIDFGNPNIITLNSRGDGERTDIIEVAGDRDLFRFTAPASGIAYVQIVTPTGSILNGQAVVLNAPNESAVVASDFQGIPGAQANLTFNVTQGVNYYIIVSGIGGSTGSYTVRVDAVAATIDTQVPELSDLTYNYRIFYPEGFANKNVREFVSIANPNNFAVSYSLILRYESGVRDAVVQQHVTLAPGARGGATLSAGGGVFAPGVRANSPYAIEIVSTGPLGATLSHYDFNSSTAEAFTSEISETWVLPRIERAPGLARDFVLFFNPHPFAVQVNFVATTAGGQQITVTRQVQALRRGGLDINSLTQLPAGIFGATVTATPVNPAHAGQFEGVVVSLTHFDLDDGYGYGALAVAGGGTTAGAVTQVTQGSGRTSEVVLYNPGTQPATVDLVGNYVRVNLPNFTNRVTVAAGGTLRLTGLQLGLTANQPAGISFVSNRPIAAFAAEVHNGDANGSNFSTHAGTQWFFGDAFIGKKNAGINYFETLSFYNPAGIGVNVSVRLLYSNGSFDTITVNIAARDYAEINLHQNSVFLNNPNSTRDFAIFASANTPFIANLTHYDLFLGGGWSNTGANIGLLNPLSRIV
ncbi:MAG: hypothetical protein KIT24_07230 [Phycisphaeraceae bacterium]|nr:hypothetical protein [Phycisphaeraceae bacterium]